VSAVVVGPRELADQVSVAVNRLDWVATTPDVPAEAWASAVAAHLKDAGAAVVLAGNGPASRVLIGAVAARLRVPLLAPVLDVTSKAGGLEVTRMVFGGIALERDLVSGGVCIMLDGGSRGGRTPEHEPVPVEPLDVTHLPMTCSCDAPPAPLSRDLASAPRVIGVGRGLRDAEYLDEVAKLADVLGAEIACSRPVAEDLGWLPHDRYLGVSGRRIAPKLYLMLGISGELQHMIGVRDAELIVAVNSDPRAPVITASDIAVIGDLRAIVPALIRQLALAR
jgi:electron transfer flavoprotein alpha subunit